MTDVIPRNIYPWTGIEVDFTQGPPNADDGTAGTVMQDWIPQGENVGGAVGFADPAGQPDVQTVLELGNGTIPYTYLVPPWDGSADDPNLMIMPEMMCFAEVTDDPRDISTVIYTLPHLNQILNEAHLDFREASDATNTASTFPDAVTFRGYLEKYGERALEEFHMEKWVRKRSQADLDRLYGNDLKEMENYYRLAQTDLLCWNTKFGVMSKTNYLGSVMTVNRPISLEDRDDTTNTAHYCNLAVAVKRRAMVANVFGSADRISAGARLFLVLKRKEIVIGGKIEPGPLCIYPYGGPETYLRDVDVRYHDPSGRITRGHVYKVGVVQFPGKTSPSPSGMQIAAGTVFRPNLRAAYEDHAGLPTLQVTLGFGL